MNTISACVYRYVCECVRACGTTCACISTVRFWISFWIINKQREERDREREREKKLLLLTNVCLCVLMLLSNFHAQLIWEDVGRSFVMRDVCACVCARVSVNIFSPFFNWHFSSFWMNVVCLCACALLLLRRRLRCIYVFCLNLHTHTHIIYTYATNYFCFIHSDLYEEIATATRPPHPFSINFPSRLLFPHWAPHTHTHIRTTDANSCCRCCCCCCPIKRTSHSGHVWHMSTPDNVQCHQMKV